MSRFLKWFLAMAHHASLLAWVASFGLGAALSTALTNSLELDQPWNWIFFAGVALAVLGCAVPLAQAAFAWLGNKAVQLDAHSSQVRAALTAVRDELLKLEDGMRRALDHAELPPPADAAQRTVFPVAAWVNNSAFLAGNPGVQDAYKVARAAYAEVERLNQEVRGDIPTDAPAAADFRAPVTQNTEAYIEPALPKVSDAVRALDAARKKV